MSDIPLCEKELLALVDKLALQKRHLKELDLAKSEPVFVIIAKGPAQRETVEKILWNHFTTKYGINFNEMVKEFDWDASQHDTCSTFRFPKQGICLMLIDRP